MIAEASAAAGSIKIAFDMAKGVMALKTKAEINLAIINIQQALLDAQAAALEGKATIARLIDGNASLEKKLADKSAWETEKSRYVLTKSAYGAFTYNLKPELVDTEISHRLCTKCFEDGLKSILHTTNAHSGGEQVTCQRCQSGLKLTEFRPTINYSRTGIF